MEEVCGFFPEARVARMDRDSTRAKNSHLEILERMTAGAIDILVGTQMIAKGHDLPGVTLVGVVCADQGIHQPDFRAAETVFSLLTQVAGRAGRGARPGRVILQTYNPEHPAIRQAVAHDYAAFAAAELPAREALMFPPAGRAVRFTLRDRSLERLESACAALETVLEMRPESDVSVLGPAPPPVALLRGEHRRHLLMTGAVGPVRQMTHWLLARIAETTAIRPLRVDVDIDPQNLT